jgi:RND family efflux transporter MFP subunit
MPRPALRHLLAAAVAAAALGACGRTAKVPQAPAAAGTGTAAAPPSAQAGRSASRLAAPERVRYAPRVAATGTLKARQSAALAVSVPGTLLRIGVKRGQEVKEGTLLAALDDGAAAATVRQAEAAVAAAKAQLALAEDALARVTKIKEQDGVSDAQAFQVRVQRDLATAQLAAAEAQLALARVNHDHHFLRAPFPGVVTQVPDGVGITVSPGVPLVTVVSTRQLILETSLTQEEAAELHPGARAQVTVPASGARTGDATVAVVVPAVDAATNRVPVEVTVPNPDGRFLPNAFARAELPRRAEREAYKVPAGSLVQRAASYAVWVAGRDGKARALPVRLLAEDGDTAVIMAESGTWPAGLEVIEEPPLGIADGAAVAEAGR